MRKHLLILLFFSYSIVVKAQRPGTGVWATVNIPVSISKHWQWYNDASYRTLGSSFAPLQYLYRPGLRYLVNKKFSIATGVAFFFTKIDFDKSNHEFGNEFRLWQEGLYQQTKYKWQWQVRLRSEQRFFEATSIKAKYKAYRYRIKAAVTRMFTKKWGVQLANEYMRQAKDTPLIFDQNRLIVMGICHPNTTTQLQAGYMWVKRPDGDQHILTVSVIKNIKLNGQRKTAK